MQIFYGSLRYTVEVKTNPSVEHNIKVRNTKRFDD